MLRCWLQSGLHSAASTWSTDFNAPATTTSHIPTAYRAIRTSSARSGGSRRQCCAIGRKCRCIALLRNRVPVADCDMETRIDCCMWFVNEFPFEMTSSDVPFIIFRSTPTKAVSNWHRLAICKSCRCTNRTAAHTFASQTMDSVFRLNVKWDWTLPVSNRCLFYVCFDVFFALFLALVGVESIYLNLHLYGMSLFYSLTVFCMFSFLLGNALLCFSLFLFNALNRLMQTRWRPKLISWATQTWPKSLNWINRRSYVVWRADIQSQLCLGGAVPKFCHIVRHVSKWIVTIRWSSIRSNWPIWDRTFVRPTRAKANRCRWRLYSRPLVRCKRTTRTNKAICDMFSTHHNYRLHRCHHIYRRSHHRVTYRHLVSRLLSFGRPIFPYF